MSKKACLSFLVCLLLLGAAAPASANPVIGLEVAIALQAGAGYASCCIQYQEPPDPCYVCSSWGWPDAGGTGPQCNPLDISVLDTRKSCTCTGPNGATVGGSRYASYQCGPDARYHGLDIGPCETAHGNC